jgi:hypothetical protein
LSHFHELIFWHEITVEVVHKTLWWKPIKYILHSQKLMTWKYLRKVSHHCIKDHTQATTTHFILVQIWTYYVECGLTHWCTSKIYISSHYYYRRTSTAMITLSSLLITWSNLTSISHISYAWYKLLKIWKIWWNILSINSSICCLLCLLLLWNSNWNYWYSWDTIRMSDHSCSSCPHISLWITCTWLTISILITSSILSRLILS